MNLIKHIHKEFSDIKTLNYKFVSTPPFPMIVLDNFLPKSIASDMADECNAISSCHWKEFTRRNSYMQELNDLHHASAAEDFTNQMHSQQGMNWLQSLTGIKDLVPDPYLIGAGYSKSYSGCKLAIHTDFNWNNTIKLHRMLSLIVYINKDWKEEWGGHLHFNDFFNKGPVQKVAPLFNRAVIWRHHERGFHGFPDPLACPKNQSRNSFRLFFYVSNLSPEQDPPAHRSLYWYNEETGEPYDIPTQK